MPFAFFLGRLCEEFPCFSPSMAYREWQAAPVGFLESIIEMRAYARAKQTWDAHGDKAPRTEMIGLVKLIDFEIAHEDIDG